MKQFKLILISVFAGAFGPIDRFRTANAGAAPAEAVAGDLSDIQARLAALEEENAALKAEKVGAPAADPLGLGGLQLPKGVETKDVLWRKQSGLSLKHAVAAALAQVRFVAAKAKKLAEAKKAKA